ncbi:unnamed protein product [Mytilus coruscus]|uniref:Reverse transcriptase domain-containing protein n=1 Tax=Mytilus coruscus TaxID=42192 RepID=A0A6J8E013_MYTCO|nr:unnamed protein product [Mytilus coruscus]
MESLLITKAKCEKLKNNIPLFITTVDVQSAFDVVKHIILMDKLLDQNIPPDLLQLIKGLYTDLESKVKWMGDISDSFNIKQGVRQGGILSTHLYKLYVQDLLEELKNNSIGFHLGNIYIGAIPVEGELHKRQLSMLYSLLSAKNQTIQDLVQRQSSINFDNPKSFFFCAMETLQLYNLPNIWELQSSLPTKYKWKTLVNLKMSKYWNNVLQIDTAQKTSLKYLAINQIKMESRISPTALDVRKGIIKSRMMTRTYTLQADRHKFSRYEIAPTCPMCNQEPEDLIHMLTTCSALSETRKETFNPIKSYVTKFIGERKWKETFIDRHKITVLIIDCTNFIYIYLVKASSNRGTRNAHKRYVLQDA